jgi:hypothetical protein
MKWTHMPVAIHQHPHDARRRLAELGVAVEALINALRAGHVARLSCTDNDAPFIPGTEAWRFVLRTLREELLPKGWRKADPGNYSLVVSDKRKINIAVATGDAFTRDSRGTPRTKSPKGLYTEAVTIRNRYEQPDLFPETLPENVRRAATVLEYQTWILLFFITDDEFRAELSLPNEIEDDQIVSWYERIFIPDEPDDAGGAKVSSTEDSGPDITVPVRRKA